jgi:hypothetical protein
VQIAATEPNHLYAQKHISVGRYRLRHRLDFRLARPFHHECSHDPKILPDAGRHFIFERSDDWLRPIPGGPEKLDAGSLH